MPELLTQFNQEISEAECEKVATKMEDADQHSSSNEYSKRFSGGVGRWMLKVQEEILLSLISTETKTVMDLGGGHGQIARPLSETGRTVTVLGSAPSCSSQLCAEIAAGTISFKVGDLIEPPFPDRSFDSVTSFRIISHCADWPKLIAQMCRVADKSVIFDYPVWLSANILTPLLFNFKRRIEGNTRSYTIFSTSELCIEFAKHGFKPVARRKQFFFPMGIHRALRSPKISKLIEGIAAGLGLTANLGSPVIIRFDRISSDNK